ncbi:MAG: DPP IV N-terminal domain-containing protein [Candidatus Aminicenantes bacterium]|nr:DPP IV N-terminal domain-containing protein [Candidatus Aminicenantes bacterium]
MREKWQGLAVDLPERPSWIGTTHRFWYRKSVPGGFQFVLVDADKASKAPAFDPIRVAAELAGSLKKWIDPKKLPFTSIAFVDAEKAIQFEAEGFRWKFELESGVLSKLGPVEPRRPGGGGLGQGGPPAEAASASAKPSPDGQWEAFIRDYNVFVRAIDKAKKMEFPLSYDGGEGNYYTYRSLVWSPDSKKIAAVRIKPGFHRFLTYIESSPVDQRQPKYSEFEYAKPGDVLDLDQPVLLLLEDRRSIAVDNARFPNPYDLTPAVWRKDSRAFTFEYNQRGHQVYRIIEVNGTTGAVRAVLSEEPKTFFCYSSKKFRFDLADGKDVVWMSERDGWNHLYLIDGATGLVKNQITKGEWVVREVDKVDETAGQVYFQASGMDPGIDPYFVQYFRINLDGSGLTRLTEGEANHTAVYSSDMAYMVDTRSRVDSPPVMNVRRTLSREVVLTAETTDISALVKAGWKAPEVFTAKARDGRTDIWGVIYRPLAFNPKKKYPVIENIYAGPHGSFAPKTFSAYSAMQALAEIGFIVVQMDGLGTSNRSKEFHDYAWKNLGDAGFPDRILWHKAAAAKYPSYDITRVGIYGTSAGGQSALGGLLFHPEFYKAGFAACGCHDNRMDKIWWNEQWMGWPLGPEYAAASNVDNAYRLQGKLLLIVGEMDQNVDPASTYQVVNALIKANKTFDLLVIPGAGHTAGGDYGARKRNDFFVHALLGVEPPDWNKSEPPEPAKK